MVKRSRDAEAELNLPPGFRFHPTDEELVLHYLCPKTTNSSLPVPIIAEVHLYKYDPWQLPEMALFGNKEWYFLTPRDRKYPNGSRPNRAAATGYWKATGADKPVTPEGRSTPVGIKKALVFYTGKAPIGVKTNWIMHEYRLADTNRCRSNRSANNGSLRLDDWVLCRLYNKKSNWENERQQNRQKQQRWHQQSQDGSFGDTSDSFEAIEETTSEIQSQRRPESDEENDAAAAVANAIGGGGQKIKEDNEWFMDINFGDLNNSFAATAYSGGIIAPSLDIPSFPADFAFGSLLSPRTPSQINLLNF